MQDKLAGLRRLRGRNFLSDLDFAREDLEDMLGLAVVLKDLWRTRPLTPFFPGKHLAMIFEAASTRTRVSFENGFAELGGNAVYLRPGEIHLPGRESVADTARTLSQYNAAIVIRSKADEVVNELAAWSSVPVINAMDHDRHPCQAMSDAFTIFEQAGRLEGVTFAYIGDAAHPCNSLSTTLTKLGLNVRIGNAPGYEIAPEIRAERRTLRRRKRGLVPAHERSPRGDRRGRLHLHRLLVVDRPGGRVRGPRRCLQALPGQRRALEPHQARSASSCTVCRPCGARRSPTRSPTARPRSSSPRHRTACTSKRRSCSPSSASTGSLRIPQLREIADALLPDGPGSGALVSALVSSGQK